MAHRSYSLADGSRAYAAFYYGPDGRRRTELVATVPEGAPKREHTIAAKRAELKAAEQRAAVRNGVWIDPQEKRQRSRTFGELVELFLAGYRSKSGKVDFYEERSKAWLAHIPAATPLTAVTVQSVDRFKRERSRKVGPPR